MGFPSISTVGVEEVTSSTTPLTGQYTRCPASAPGCALTGAFGMRVPQDPLLQPSKLASTGSHGASRTSKPALNNDSAIVPASVVFESYETSALPRVSLTSNAVTPVVCFNRCSNGPAHPLHDIPVTERVVSRT